ncbi:hypothetical protein AB0J83_08975 [Actinoplanes sp. NPDC049596]|uniref:hypothetical protein n=1 Tax=unclassified Actinoplanes TaxID=2626549 RepID=UPI003413E8A3
MPSEQDVEPMQRIARQVADCVAESGYAFVEDDKLEALSAALTAFLSEADIPTSADCGVLTNHQDVGS